MHYDIEFKPRATKDLKPLSQSERARIVFKVEGRSLVIYRVMHRGEAYR